jgi:Tol biopolymer transport system component
VDPLSDTSPEPTRRLETSVASLAVALGWFAASAFGIATIGFPSRSMVAFLAVAWLPLALLGRGAPWLARLLSATDTVSNRTRAQAAAVFGVFGFIVPLAAMLWVPGVRLEPVTQPPGRLTHAFAASGLDGDMEVYLYRGGALPLRLTDSPGADMYPALSSNGETVVFASNRDGDWDLYVLSVMDPSSVRQVTNDPSADWDPVWSPSGSRIAFASDRSGDWDVWSIRADGARPRNLTNDPLHADVAPNWSPDGASIAFARGTGGAESDVCLLPLDGGDTTNVTQGAAGWATGPVWSSDGTRLAFTAWGGGNGDVYTIAVDGTDLRRLTDLPSDEWAGGWFDEDRHIWLISNAPDLGFNFAYFIPSSGGEMVLYQRG